MTHKPKVKVLIVEDEATYRKIFKGYFKKEGWSVTTAENYQIASNYLDERYFHVVTVDIRLIAGDQANEEGMRLLDKICNSQDETKTIVITGYPSGKRYRRAFRDYDVLDFFEKSTLDKNELIEQVSKGYYQVRGVMDEQREKLRIQDFVPGFWIQLNLSVAY